MVRKGAGIGRAVIPYATIPIKTMVNKSVIMFPPWLFGILYARRGPYSYMPNSFSWLIVERFNVPLKDARPSALASSSGIEPEERPSKDSERPVANREYLYDVCHTREPRLTALHNPRDEVLLLGSDSLEPCTAIVRRRPMPAAQYRGP